MDITQWFSLRWSNNFFYFGSNFIIGVPAKVPHEAFNDPNSLKTEDIELDGSAFWIQMPIGFQYNFNTNRGKTRFGIRIAYVPTLVLATADSPSSGSYSDSTLIGGELYYWTGSRWIKASAGPADVSYKSCFELTMSLFLPSSSWCFSSGFLFDFACFSNTKLQLSVGYIIPDFLKR